MPRSSIVYVCVVLSLSVQLGCSSDSAQSPVSPSVGPRLVVESIAASAAAGGVQGGRRPGVAPSGTAGPRITASGNERVINGGTQTVALSGDAPFDRVYVFVGGKTMGLIGESEGNIEGYYEIQLPAPQTSTTVLLTFPQEIPLTEFDLRFAVASPSSAVGPSAGLATAVTSVGTGDVQVTLSWDADSDVDLHVVAPGGDEIFYGRRQSPSGGELDLDSNAACEIDRIRNENITWPIGRAPRGDYIVRVDYWSNCGVVRTEYTVRINNGGAVQIVSGSFTGAGNRGGAGSGQTVATFSRTAGPTAIVTPQPPETLTPAALSKTLGKTLGLER